MKPNRVYGARKESDGAISTEVNLLYGLRKDVGNSKPKTNKQTFTHQMANVEEGFKNKEMEKIPPHN